MIFKKLNEDNAYIVNFPNEEFYGPILNKKISAVVISTTDSTTTAVYSVEKDLWMVFGTTLMWLTADRLCCSILFMENAGIIQKIEFAERPRD